ncbi:beta-glucanase [Tricladium varicosporioides]|nr:beta-glucanase [Hymenoscyphus varicosporioides]
MYFSSVTTTPLHILVTFLLINPIYAAVPTISGYTLTWSDDFAGAANTLPSTTNWIIDTGTSYPGGPANWGTGETQVYTNKVENLSLSGNGSLSITPIKDASGGWTSARIETQRKDFLATKGKKMRIQASIAMPAVGGTEALGYWPAFWTLGGAYRGNYQNWPAIGEFDIMENVNGINKVWGVIHCDVNPGGVCKETDGLSNNLQCPGTPCQGNFHTYTLEVDRSVTPETLKWMADERVFHTITETQLGSTIWAQAVHQGHFILVNLAMGGAFPNNQHGSATPLVGTVSGKPLKVEYVAVYNN